MTNTNPSAANQGAANQSSAEPTGPANARDRAMSAIEELGENPLALLAGGVALGVLAGVLLPRAEKERELLDPVGRTLAERASATVRAAKEAGRQEIDSLIPDRDATKERVSALFGNILEAAKDAGQRA